jgi:hypothetical protein
MVGWNPICASASPPLLSGVGLRLVCGVEARFSPHTRQVCPCSLLLLLPFPLSSLFWGEWWQVTVATMQLVVAAVTLDTSWALPWTDLAVVGTTLGGVGVGVWACMWHMRPALVLNPAGSAPRVAVPCGALALAGAQQLNQNWCGPRDMTN